VLVEVLLEIEVGELLRLRNLEELAESSIRSDVVLILEVLFLHILVELLGDIGARDESTRGVTEETAELIRDLGGDLKDSEATLDGLTSLSHRRSTALTTTSILDLTVDTLVKALDLSDHRGYSVTERGEGGEDGLEVVIKSGNRGGRGCISSGDGGNRRGRGGYRSRSSGGDRSNRGSRLASSLLGLSNNRSRSGGGYRGDRGRSSRGIVGLLGNALGLGGGGSSGGAHHTSTGGRIHLK
jgi:hypothetical protein